MLVHLPREEGYPLHGLTPHSSELVMPARAFMLLPLSSRRSVAENVARTKHNDESIAEPTSGGPDSIQSLRPVHLGPLAGRGCGRGQSARQMTNVPRKTPKTKTTRKINKATTNRTFAIDFAPDSTLPNPKNPAINEMTRNKIAHFSMLIPLST